MLAFYVEVLRVERGITECAMPVHPFRGISRYKGVIPTSPENARKLAEMEIRSSEGYEILREMGLEAIPYPSMLDRVLMRVVPDFIVYVCRRERKERVEGILRKIRRAEMRAISGSKVHALKVLRMEGRLLGYPECCVSSFVRLKGEGISPEARTVELCIEEGLFGTALEIFEKGGGDFPEELYSFFTSNFYPCRPGCERAVRIGKAIEDSLDEGLRVVYRFKIILNVLNVLSSAYATYRFVKERGVKSDFGRIVKEFFESLGEGRVKTVERVASEILRDQLDFESRCLFSIRTM